MKAQGKKKTLPKGDSKVLEIKPLETWIKEENNKEAKFEDFLCKGEVNLLIGSPDPNKALFAFWLGIRMASKVDSVHHFSFSEKGKLLPSIKDAPVPDNLFSAFIQEQNDSLYEQVSHSIKSRQMAPKSNHVLIIDGLELRRTRSRHNRIKAKNLITSISDLRDELNKKEILLTVFFIADVDAKEKIWESTEFRDFSHLKTMKNFQVFYFARSKSPAHLNHYYVKPLRASKFRIGRILLFEFFRENGNCHFKLKSWDDEKYHLPLSPMEKAKTEIYLIGILGLAVIKQKYWNGINPVSFPNNPDQEKYIIEILEMVYIAKPLLPFSHIEYLTVNTNITETRFNEVARNYFKSIGRKYDLQLSGWNIE